MNRKQFISLALFATSCLVLIKFNPLGYILQREAKTYTAQVEPNQETRLDTINLDFIDSKTWKAIAHDPTSQMLKVDSIQWLQHEEEEIWNKLHQLGIGKQVYLEHEVQYRQDYAKLNKVGKPDAPTISTKTINLIKPILQQFDIDPNKVQICHLALPIPIATNDEAMLINESIFNKMSHKGKLFTIAHEAQHIKFKDDSHLYILEELIKSNNIDKEKAQSIMSRVQRFLEARADYYAASKDQLFAEGLVESTIRMLQVQGENSIATHPMKKTRIALGNKILQSHSHA